MNTPSSNPPSFTSRWLIVALLMGYAAMAHFNRVGISVAGSEVFIRKLGFTETSMGWVYTTFLIVYTLGMMPGGWLIDRLGAVRALTLLGLGMGGFVAVTGMVGWVLGDPSQLWMALLVVRGCAGLFNAPLHPGAAHVVSDITGPRGRATANGMVTAGALIGIAFCFPVFGWLMDRLGWQLAFIVSGGALIAYGLAFLTLTRALWSGATNENAKSRSVEKDGEGSRGDRTNEDAEASEPNGDAVSLTAGESLSMLMRGQLWLLTLSYAAFGYFQYLFFYWMNHYFEKVLHVPDVESRNATFYIMLAQGAGMAVGGMSTDIVCKMLGLVGGRRSIVMTGMGVSAVCGLIAVNLNNSTSVAWCLAVAMAALGLCEGVFWTTATDLGGKARGLAGAFMNTGGNVGGLISPVFTPFIAESLGWGGAIAVACAVNGLGGAVWFFIRPNAAART